jgi:hypothetical protein
MISTVKATVYKLIGAMANDLLPPRDLAKAASAVMVWASSKMSAEERATLLNGLNIAIRDRTSSLPSNTMSAKDPTAGKPKRRQSATRSTGSTTSPRRRSQGPSTS